MKRHTSITRLVLLITLVLLAIQCFSITYGQRPSSSQSSPAASQQSAESGSQKYFTDVELINQDGQKMRLYSDLIKGRVVVINCFFATCQGACLPMSRNMQKLQEALGDRVGKDLYLISITVDPTMDTPERLKQFAAKVAAKPGWFFLTGEKANVDFAQKKLGQYVEEKNDHNNIFIIGNERTGLWKKAFGLAKVEELVPIVESVLNDKGAGR